MVNDTMIAVGIILFFIFMGVFLPIINSEFNEVVQSYDLENVSKEIGQSESTARGIFSWSDTSLVGILWSVFTMFTWSFGQLPIWIELAFFLPLRMFLFMILYRNIRSGSG